MRRSRAYLSMLAAILIAPAIAQETMPAPADSGAELPQVLISSVKDPFKIAYSSVLKALDAQKEKPLLAPDATPRWMTLSRNGIPLSRTGMITIVGANGQMVIAQDGGGGFELPSALPAIGGDIELRINARRSELIFVPVVATRGIDASRRRLGDLRLECEMIWRLEYGGASMMAKAALKLMGSPCRSKNVSVPVYVGRKLKSATIARDGKAVELKLTARSMAFFAPLHDEAFNNDVLVALEFNDGEPAKKEGLKQ